MQASSTATDEGAASPRAGDAVSRRFSALTTPQAAGAVTLGALFVLIVIRRSFAGALGD